LTKAQPYARLIIAYEEGKDIVTNTGGKKPDVEVWQENRQTFSFAFRTLKIEYQRGSNIKPEAGQA
jgi:hypothetical protein